MYAPAVRGDVVEAAAAGFTVHIKLTVQAAPDDVYRTLVHNIGDWWNPDHTYSHNAHNLTLDDKAMGCFCEKLPNQGSVRHMEVVYATPGSDLRMIGGLGPLQGIAATGPLTIELTSADNAKPPTATTLQVTYAVGGYQPKGMESWAAPVNAMLTEQFTRLKQFAEKGSKGRK